MEKLSDPSLWFDPYSLQPMVSSGAWARGLSLFRDDQVHHLEIHPTNNDSWELAGQVQGSLRAPYHVSVNIALMPDGMLDYWESDCECPVGEQCKHGVALVLNAAHHGLQLLGKHAPKPHLQLGKSSPLVKQQPFPSRVHEQAQFVAEAHLLGWLEKLDRAYGKAPSAHAMHAPTKNERAEQYLYLLKILPTPGTSPRLQLELVVSYPKVHGGWAKPKSVSTMPYPGHPLYDKASRLDHEVLQLIGALPHSGGFQHSFGFSSRVLPHGLTGQLALERAAHTERLFLADAQNMPGTTIQWGPPQTLRWEWQAIPQPHASEPFWALRARMHSSSAQLCHNNPPLYLDPVQGLCGTVLAEGLESAQISALLQSPALAPSALQKHHAALQARLGALPMPPILQSLRRIQGVTPCAHLHLSPAPSQEVVDAGLIRAQLRFDYAGLRGWWLGADLHVTVDGPEGPTLLQRDPQAELEAITRLMNLGLLATDDGDFGLPGNESQQTWLHWADNGFSVLREAGFDITLDDTLHGWIHHADSLEAQLRPADESEGADTSPWFDLSLGIEIDGQRHNILPWLPDLISAAAASPLDPDSGQPTLPPFVYLRDAHNSRFLRLPTDALRPWMAALLELVGDRAHDFTGDSLRLSRLDALRTSAALGEGVTWEGARTLRDMLRQLQGRSALPDIPVPSGVQASLRPYQQHGLNWLQFLRQHGLAGILADDMGLGKTLQTLAHIQVEKDAGRLTHPALIIAPVSLMGNWQREAARFCPGLRSLVLHGKDRHELAESMGQHDLVIAPYSLLQRDRERWMQAPWHIVVLDEAQNIKNANSHAAQVVSQLQAHHRLCLSGTPMENHLGEIWSLFHFLMPGFLGSEPRFKKLFRTPIEKQADNERMAQLRARITPFMLRRTKALVASELPPKIETVMRVELSGKQADLYETIRLGMEKTVRDALSTKGLAKSQITILDALLKLRQVCCAPQLLALDAAKQVKASAKLEQLMEMLPEMIVEGRRILLFSQFTSMLTLIEAELKKRKLSWVKLTGQSQKRDALIEQFTSGQVPLFLISLKAGGVGLNLPQADTVIHYDPWWNPAVENQATDRAHRIGQTHSVWVVKLVAQGTIEERILSLQERKALLADSMYSGATARKEPLFSEHDLTELLKPLSS